MKKCVLHIGFHKTGSSSLQRLLKKNRTQLLSMGYIYPDLKMVGSDRVFFNHSIPFNVSLKGRLSHQASLENLIASREQSDFFLNQISDILSKGSNVIFSGEGLSVLSRSEIIYINQYIQSHGYSTEWVAVVRAPYQFFCSNVQQQIKEGARYYNLSRLDKVNPSIFSNISSRIQKFLSIDSISLSFLSYDKLCSSPDGLLKSVVKELGIQEFETLTLSRLYANKSMGNMLTRLQNMRNKVVSRLD